MDELDLDSMFPEPPRPPSPEPTISTYERDSAFVKGPEDWSAIDIRLVGDHPLWGHHLWNAARSFASYLDTNTPLYKNLNVLELGAGGALPSLVAAKNHAGLVVITDYPDDSLIDNIQFNISRNLNPSEHDRSFARGYIWGRSTDELLALAEEKTGRGSYDLIILSDLVFNHSQHDALLTTCESALTPSSPSPSSGSATVTPSVLVFYTHHRPHLAHRDMEFFSKAEARGWAVEKVVEERFPPMFPDDPGDEEVRSTVHGWKLTRPPP
ncbi:hypothetical protein FA13DRAFT_1726356 [Coprinellus micaceus]|uniref:Protein N-terminal and lysine N-methyltransferase EFM7 n=1 Tax=Coprinellus micaceus TaxID=71717 RepID=A0A4Y7TSV9_COPMI|nr:hypothetical protein FA13DRAFT_1726356 [Coprinellus micaceus]